MVLPAVFSFAERALVGLGAAALLALVLALLVDGRSYVEQLGVACLVVGAIALLMGFGGHSPSMRLGLQNQYLASFFPALARRVGDPYPKTRVSDSAIFVLVGMALAVAGLVLV